MGRRIQCQTSRVNFTRFFVVMSEAKLKSGSKWAEDGTQVFSGVAPMAFTDLDLSAFVGEKSTLVLLKLETTVGSNENYVCRPKGETEENSDATGCAGVKYLDTGDAAYMIVSTDSAGIIEWRTMTTASCKIWLMGYLG